MGRHYLVLYDICELTQILCHVELQPMGNSALHMQTLVLLILFTQYIFWKRICYRPLPQHFSLTGGEAIGGVSSLAVALGLYW